jgi:hypothetical protein
MAWPAGEPSGQPRHPPEWRPVVPFPSPALPPHRGEPDGLGWALIPFLTLGFGTPPAFVYVAARSGSSRLGVAAAGYGLASAGTLAILSLGHPELGAIMMITIWIIGTVHAFAIRPKVFPRATPGDRLNRHAIEVARYRRGLRDQARRLAASDPALAHDLRIGRPDLPRSYDDGGLLDVNHAPPQTFALLPDLPDEVIQRIVRLRAERGGFVSAEELAVDADLPPNLASRLTEYLIFLP